MNEITYRRKKSNKGIVIGILAGILILAALVIFGLFRVQEIVILGNDRFTATEIQEAVMQDGLCKNTLYMLWKYNDQSKAEEALPFLSAVEVEMLTPYKVQIRVYEKIETGYLQYQGSNVYFDQKGMVIENSREVHEAVPRVTGVSVTKVNLFENLAIENTDLFDTVISLARSLNKSELVPGEIRFDEEYEITLIFSEIRVLFGTGRELEDKVAALQSIFPKLAGMKGTLDMENYTSNSQTITFKKGDGEEEIEVGDGQEEDTEAGTENETETGETGTGGRTYSESDGTFSTDENGNKIYTDAAGNVTDNADQYNYTDENGNIIEDGYGYIDPYTGNYIN